jgi:polyisoprenoid-binding protein YceI
MKIKAVVFVLGVGVALPALAQPAYTDFSKVEAGTYVSDKGHARLIFSYSHFGYSIAYGLFTDFSGKLSLDPKTPTASALEVTVNLNGIDTTVPKLDEHLKSSQFFDVAKFPEATFKSAKITASGPNTGTVVGDLTLHGVTKPVTLAATFNGGGVNPATKAVVVGFNATGTVKRSEFGLGALEPMVGDDVTLTISAEFDRMQ